MKQIIFSLLQSQLLINIRSFLRQSRIGRIFHNLWASLINKQYEDRFQQYLMKSIRIGDIVWDVGANVGFYTQKFLDAVGSSGQVIAIEPAPLSAEECRQIAKKNNRTNLLVIESALGNKNGTAKLTITEDQTSPNNWLSGLSASCGDYNSITVPIQGKRVLTIFDRITRL
jgi:FkbM family methyltransferase